MAIMNTKYWYWGLTRGYAALFGNMFNDIRVIRTNSVGDVVQDLQCPIDFAAKQKIIRRINEAKDLTQQNIATNIPRLSYAIVGKSRDTTRQLIPITKNVHPEPNIANSLLLNYAFIPIDLEFELYVYTKNLDDAYQIDEQITPFFQPDWALTVNMVKPMNYKDDIIILLNGSSFTDNYEGVIDTRRMIIWTYNFTMKCRYYGPTKRTGLIKRVAVNMITPEGAITPSNLPDDPIPLEQYIITPGLTANGQPTSNSSLTIPYNQIEPDDDWTYIIEKRDSDFLE